MNLIESLMTRLGRAHGKDQTECAIFDEFATVCRYDIDRVTIQKRPPPEPDFLCNSSVGKVAFELVELDHKRVCEVVRTICIYQGLLYSAYWRRWPWVRSTADFRLRRTELFFNFRGDVDEKTHLDAIPDFLDAIIPLPEGNTGEVTLTPKLSRSLRSITFVRGDCEETIFTVPAFEFTGIPLKERLAQKLGNSYPIAIPLELLIYVQDAGAASMWLNDVAKLVKARLEGSQFRRAWVFDRHSKAILATWPEVPWHLPISEAVKALVPERHRKTFLE